MLFSDTSWTIVSKDNKTVCCMGNDNKLYFDKLTVDDKGRCTNKNVAAAGSKKNMHKGLIEYCKRTNSNVDDYAVVLCTTHVYSVGHLETVIKAYSEV